MKEEQTPENTAPVEEKQLLQWQAHEFTPVKRDAVWYLSFFGIVAAMVGGCIFFSQYVFAVLICVMAVALYLYAQRTPNMRTFRVTTLGVYADDTLMPYEGYRSFSVFTSEHDNYIVFTPANRLGIGFTVHFPTEVGEELVDLMAARLPVEERSRDIFDKILTKLKL